MLRIMSKWTWFLFTSATLLTSTSFCWCHSWYKCCVLDVNRDLVQQNAPVLLRRRSYGYELAGPDAVVSVKTYFKGIRRTGVIRVAGKGEIYAACPGYGNAIHGLEGRRPFATYNCNYSDSRASLRMGAYKFKSHRVRCTQPVATTIRDTGQTCGPGAKLYEVGYSIIPEYNPSWNRYLKFMTWLKFGITLNGKKTMQAGQRSFYPVLSCCYDPSRVRTLYSVNVLEGAKIAGADAWRAQPPPYIVGQDSLYPAAFNVHNAYKLPHQQEVLRTRLGQDSADALLNSSLLARGHLASAQDFLMGNWQASSFNYLNVVPQWQSVNLSIWHILEGTLRRVADTSQMNFIIATGTYGVFKVTENSNKPEELYLDSERQVLPVPEVLWKVVYSPRNRSCIAFLMTNRPSQEGPPSPNLCRNICSAHGWLPWTDHLHCCVVEELRAAVNYVPEYPCDEVLDYIPEETPVTTTSRSWFRRKLKKLF